MVRETIIPFKAKWGICLLLLLATTQNYLDRQTLSILAPRIQHEMGLDNEALGWLFSGFYYAYTIAQFGVGSLLDRGNLRWVYGFAIVGWSIACGLTGLAQGFFSLLIFRLLLGIMEAANWPGAMRIVARTLPAEQRAFGNGLFTSGTSIGALIAPAIVLGIANVWGWRSAFYALGTIGIFWLAAWIPFSGMQSMRPVWAETKGSAGRKGTFATYIGIIRIPQFWRVFLVAILVNPSQYFFLNWLPTYLSQRRGISRTEDLTIILTVVYLGLDLGNLTGGAGIVWLTRRGISLSTARRIVFMTASCLMLSSAALPFLERAKFAIAIMIAINFALGIWVSMYLTMAQEVDLDNVSTVAGMLGGSGSLAGAVAMWAVGHITKLTGSFAMPLVAVAGAGVLAAIAGWSVSNPRNAVAGLANQTRTLMPGSKTNL